LLGQFNYFSLGDKHNDSKSNLPHFAKKALLQSDLAESDIAADAHMLL
jgi:hypothetical protein